MCQVAGHQLPPELGVFIAGNTSLCLLGGTVIPSNYSPIVLAPAPDIPNGQGPYTYEWRWSEDGFFNPGFYLGNTATIPITQALACPQFFLRLNITSADGTTATHTRRVGTNLCTFCIPQGMSQPTEAGGSVFADTQDINVFPNPAEGYLQIESARELQSVALWDMTGRQVLRSETAVASHEGIRLDLSGLPGGVYFLSAQTATETLVRKVILQPSTSK
jgi:hypothetical protein